MITNNSANLQCLEARYICSRQTHSTRFANCRFILDQPLLGVWVTLLLCNIVTLYHYNPRNRCSLPSRGFVWPSPACGGTLSPPPSAQPSSLLWVASLASPVWVQLLGVACEDSPVWVEVVSARGAGMVSNDRKYHVTKGNLYIFSNRYM